MGNDTYAGKVKQILGKVTRAFTLASALAFATACAANPNIQKNQNVLSREEKVVVERIVTQTSPDQYTEKWAKWFTLNAMKFSAAKEYLGKARICLEKRDVIGALSKIRLAREYFESVDKRIRNLYPVCHELERDILEAEAAVNALSKG